MKPGDIMIKLFSLSHIFYLLVSFIICLIFYFLLKNKNNKFKYIATFIPLILSFIIHFLKLLIPEYRNNFPISIISITPETICAISTLTFPFIYISKNNKLKDYMVVMGIISGIVTLIIPTEIQGYPIFNIETIRFFFAHLVIFMSSFFMYIFKIHTPTKKWVKNTLVIFLIACIIMIIDGLLFTYILEGKQAFLELLKQLNILR